MPWQRFAALVDEYGADARVRRLPSKGQFLALLYGQLSGALSLREIEAGLLSHQARLYHVGCKDPVRRSTLSDANAQRPAALFAQLLATMIKQAHRGLRRKLAETTYLIDATSVRLSERSAGWARFSAGVRGAKVHVIYDADADRPIYAAVSAAKSTTSLRPSRCPSSRRTYVFDLGYYDYAFWASLDAAGCRIVTRFKSNTPLDMVEELPVASGGNVLSDRIGFLPARQARNRRNPMQDAIREICVTTETGKRLRILSNDLDASAEEIAELYRRRWPSNCSSVGQADPQDHALRRTSEMPSAYRSAHARSRRPPPSPSPGGWRGSRSPPGSTR